MNIWPVPTTPEWLDKTIHHWFPFVKEIAEHSGEDLKHLCDLIIRGETQIILVMDGDKCVALCGVRLCKRGEDTIGELIWMTGQNKEAWQGLLPELERYLKDTGCAESRPICRLGWVPFLKKHGYKPTHTTMEKVL